MQTGSSGREREERAEIQDMERRIMEGFLSKPRKPPPQPAWSRTSIVIIRKEVVPFYYAIYDHAQERFVELHYKSGPNSPLRTIEVTGEVQPGSGQTKAG